MCQDRPEVRRMVFLASPGVERKKPGMIPCYRHCNIRSLLPCTGILWNKEWWSLPLCSGSNHRNFDKIWGAGHQEHLWLLAAFSLASLFTEKPMWDGPSWRISKARTFARAEPSEQLGSTTRIYKSHPLEMLSSQTQTSWHVENGSLQLSFLPGKHGLLSLHSKSMRQWFSAGWFCLVFGWLVVWFLVAIAEYYKRATNLCGVGPTTFKSSSLAQVKNLPESNSFHH